PRQLADPAVPEILRLEVDLEDVALERLPAEAHVLRDCASLRAPREPADARVGPEARARERRGDLRIELHAEAVAEAAGRRRTGGTAQRERARLEGHAREERRQRAHEREGAGD